MKVLPVTFNTHNRTECACYCLENLIKNLKYDGSNNIFLYICDDRSDIGHIDALEDLLQKLNFKNYKVVQCDNEHWGYGYVLNKAMDEAYLSSDVVLTVEDDRLIDHEFDIKPLVDILEQHAPEYAAIKVSTDDKRWNCCTVEPALPQTLRHVQGKNSYYKFTYNLQCMLRHKCIFEKIRFNENCMPPRVEHPICNAYNDLTDFGTSGTLKVLQWLDNGKFLFSHIGDSLLGHTRFRTPIEFKDIMQTKPLDVNDIAVVLNVCDCDIHRIELASKTIKYFNPEVKIFGIVCQNLCNENIELLKKLDIDLIDCMQLFDETYPFFNKTQCSKCIQPGRKRKYPKHIFGKFLIPYIAELKQFRRILYIDNDCVILKPLQCLIRAKMQSGITVLFDGQTSSMTWKEDYAFNELKKYDKYNMLNAYSCSGVLLFDNKLIDLAEYDKFIERANTIQLEFFSDNSILLADQDIMNLCCSFSISNQQCVATKYIDVGNVIWHYYKIKKHDNFVQEFVSSIANANLDSGFVELCKQLYSCDELPFFCAGGKNFGDNCGDVVLSSLSTCYPSFKRQQFPKRLMFIGSTLNTNDKFKFGLCKDDIVYGSGCMYEDGKIEQLGKNVDIRLVRGPLTRAELAKNCIMCNEVYGDPSIFIPYAYNIKKSSAPKYKHGLALHFNDYNANFNDIRSLAAKASISIIDVCENPKVVCERIAECEHLFSSALHPLIVAEALGISATWIELPGCKVEGNGFKFYDYYLGSGRTRSDIVHLDWRLKSNIDFNYALHTKAPTYNVTLMLAAFPYILKKNVAEDIKEYFSQNNVSFI